MGKCNYRAFAIIAFLLVFFQVNSPAVAQFGNIPGGPGGQAAGAPAPSAEFDPFEGPNQATFEALNPFSLGGGTDITKPTASLYKTVLSTPGGIVSRMLVFSFPIAGLILFVMLIWGGGEILAGSASKKAIDSGKQRISAALVGFMFLFSSYWIVQILEVIFGVVIF